MKVGFLSADWGGHRDSEGNKNLIPGGSGWYRCHLPAMGLAENGIPTIVAEKAATSPNGLVLHDPRTDERHDDCDVIVFQRVMNDFWKDLADCAREAGQIIVNDVDDWYWGLHPRNRAYAATDPGLSPDSNRKHYRDFLRASDLTIASTPFLADRMTEWDIDVALIRNAVQLEVWEALPQNDPPTVGWVGSTSHRSGDLETMVGIVGPYVERYDLKFHHGGWSKDGPNAGLVMGVDVERCTQTPLCQIELYPQHFRFFDISLIPLNKIDFNAAKSFIKGLESAAAGRPFIAQDLPEYKYMRDELGVGRVARKPRDWIRHLEELRDFDVRVKEAAANRAAIEHLDIRHRWIDWADVLESLL